MFNLNFTNHIQISFVYFFLSILLAYFGFFMSVLLRYSLVWPYSYIINNNIYNALFTNHALIMIFFFIMPFTLGGLGNLLIPMYINIEDMLFPRINNLSLLLLIVSILFMMISLCYGDLGANVG
tara:strand:+ start:107 stop:478 length:372 start_codon:yes stop_codon:yes gene_type:complete